ncbi:MAG TPA: glycosyltransferase [Candidatus Angelobacter sp.]
MPRVLHVITGLASGGAEMMLLKLLSARNKDFDPMVITLDHSERQLEPAISRLGVPVCCLGMRRWLPSPMAALTLRRIMQGFRPHVIQGWMPHGNLMASLAGAASRAHVPVLWNIRMSLSEARAEPIRTRAIIRLGAFLSWHPKAIIYNSQSGARQHEAAGYRTTKRVFIPNGFDCQVFQPDENARRKVRGDLGLPEDAFLVGIVARNHPMKDHECFLRAAARVMSRYPRTRFLLIGNGVTAEDARLSKAIAELRLEKNVFLLGQRTDIPRQTAALDVACSSSFWGEGFSNSIGEAMACGIPCVATDVGDNAYVVADTGLIVPPRRPEAFAHALTQLIEAGDEHRRKLGFLARQRIEENFSLATIVRRYEELYRSQISNSEPLRVTSGVVNIDE